MGSLVARLYCQKHADSLKRAVFVGTPAKNDLAGLGLKIAKTMKEKKGSFYRSSCLLYTSIRWVRLCWKAQLTIAYGTVFLMETQTKPLKALQRQLNGLLT